LATTLSWLVSILTSISSFRRSWLALTSSRVALVSC
jgi:hypothetical protein